MEWAREMVSKLSAAENGSQGAVIAAYQTMTGLSPSTLYRMAARHGYRTGRRRRSDRGTLKCGLTDDALTVVSSLLQTTARANKGCIMPVTNAMDIARDSGVPGADQVSDSRAQAILRERNMGKKALDEETPHIRMASLHPNHVHVLDASICIQYYLRNGKGMAIVDERDFNDKKPKNMAKLPVKKLLRMMLVDHFSHFMFVKYYLVAGENMLTTFDFLSSAWIGGHHEKIPFRGLPKFLLMDAGSANINKSILTLIEELGIQIPKSLPHNPRRQGSAECAHNIWEMLFESRLRLQPMCDVEELNRMALDFLVRFNGTKKHRRHNMTRTDCWLKYIADHLVDCPPVEELRELFSRPAEPRTVRGDLTITFDTEEYRLKHIAGIRPGMKVMAKKRAMLWPQLVVIHDDVEYVVEPIGTLVGGFRADAQVIGEGYKAQPETEVQKTRKENERRAFGDAPEKGAVPFGGELQVFGHHAEKVGAVPMPRRGTPIETSRSVAVQRVPIMEFMRRLRGEIGRITPALNRELRGELGDSVLASDADRIVAAIAAGEPWQTDSDLERVGKVG